MLGVLVGTVLERSALHVVAIVQEDEFVAQLSFHLLDDEGIVGEFIVTSVCISGFNESQCGFFWGA